jgi:hypothetical protein
MYKIGMGKIVKNKYCTFLFESKNAFVKINGSINQTFVIETLNPNKKSPPLRLKDDEWLEIIDTAYRHKITDSNLFYRLVYNKYRLTSTCKKITSKGEI